MHASTPELSPEFVHAPERFELNAYDRLYLRNSFQPFETHLVEMDGQIAELPISLVLTIEGHDGEAGQRILVSTLRELDAKHIEELIVIEAPDEETFIVKPSNMARIERPKQNTRIQVGKFNLNIGAPDTTHPDLLNLSWSRYNGGQARGNAVVAPASHAFAETAEAHSKIVGRRDRVRFWGKAACVLAGLYSTVASGGLIDKAADPLFDADSVVESAVDLPSSEPSAVIDGIALEDFSREAQAEFRAEAEADYEIAHSAYERVAQTMNNLDSHSYGHIKQRAEAFRNEHRTELMTNGEIAEFHERLEGAADEEAVLRVLDDFMRYFGKTADWLDHETSSGRPFNAETTSTEDVRHLTHEIVDTLSYLPRSLVEDAGFSEILIANRLSPLLGADYSRHDRSIVLPTTSAIGELVHKAVDKIPTWLQDDHSTRITILHEIGHSFPINLPIDSGGSGEFDSSRILSQFWHDLVNIPEFHSQYAATDNEEARAEAFAFTLDRGAIVAHPDEARRFGSRANKWSLNILWQLEEKYPGITDYLVSLNPDLVDRSYVHIGRS